MKNKFAFKLGTTSYIKRDHILPNVHFLQDKVDMVELLVFETDEQSNYPTKDEVKELNDIAGEYDLTYTVHLPIGVHLGERDMAKRNRNIGALLRAIDATRDLAPHAWDLHLEPDEETQDLPIYDLSAWQDACRHSLEALKIGGADPNRIGVETLEYPFEFAKKVIDEAGYGYCLDIGHCWYRKYSEDWFIDELLPKARSIHLHGFNEERDHRSLKHIPKDKLKRFIDAVSSAPDDKVVSIEVFGEKYLTPSWEALENIYSGQDD
jgi:sugar phosphate isomerase/epimerase